MNITKRNREAEVAARVKDELEPLDIDESFIESLIDSGDLPSRYKDCNEDEIARFLDWSKTTYRCAKNDYYDALSKDRAWEEVDDRLYDSIDVDIIRDEIQAEIDSEEADDE